jgi:hypothetical protein
MSLFHGPEGDNGFDANTMKSAVSARASEPGWLVISRAPFCFPYSLPDPKGKQTLLGEAYLVLK